MSKERADLSYQLMSLRYEMKSTIITTDIPFLVGKIHLVTK
ncbi:TPA: hypothetical protein ACJHIE_002426 [Staphylococcus pseudintermedius]